MAGFKKQATCINIFIKKTRYFDMSGQVHLLYKYYVIIYNANFEICFIVHLFKDEELEPRVAVGNNKHCQPSATRFSFFHKQRAGLNGQQKNDIKQNVFKNKTTL